MHSCIQLRERTHLGRRQIDEDAAGNRAEADAVEKDPTRSSPHRSGASPLVAIGYRHAMSHSEAALDTEVGMSAQRQRDRRGSPLLAARPPARSNDKPCSMDAWHA